MTPPDGNLAARVPPTEERALAGAMPLIRWFADLGTGAKLLLVMALALAPLGFIALLASIESARGNAANRLAAANAVASGSARALDLLVVRTELTLRAAGTALGQGASPRECRQTLAALAAANGVPVEFAVVADGGRLLCATPGFSLTSADAAPGVAIARDGASLLVATPAAVGRGIGIARFSAATIAGAMRPAVDDGSYRLVLRQGSRTMTFGDSESALAGGTRLSRQAARGQVELLLTLPTQQVTATELLSILLPLATLVAAGLLAWLVIDRLMLRPLRQLQAAVLAYPGGEGGLFLPRFTTPANEIRDLADAFRRTADTIVRHEGELQEGLSRQTRLTREVHHRVKNNLQVVASLLNLHARGATLPEVRDAYAAIQRRVDALAVVHRNHYAELEENHGVALRPLIGELAANLRASAPPAAQSMRLLLDLASVHATQDVAVPVAFLITELVEAAMIREPKGSVAISLRPAGTGRARLTIASEALTGCALGPDETAGERIDRVILGLSRQLRSALSRDEEAGRLEIEIAVMGEEAAR